MARGHRPESKNPRSAGGVELLERLVSVNRVAKVVKGGRRFGFAALVVVGDGRGRAGFGSGKAREVPEAIRKAGDYARRHMFRIPLREGRTLHHDIVAKYGAGRVVLRSAPPGTGIIAGGCLRAVFEALGVSDVVTKSLRSSNPYNLIRAAFDGLQSIASPRQVASRRSQRLQDITARRDFGRRTAPSEVSTDLTSEQDLPNEQEDDVVDTGEQSAAQQEKASPSQD